MLKRENPNKKIKAPKNEYISECVNLNKLKKKKLKKRKKDALFVRILNRLLKLDCLKLLELSIGFVKGFAVKIEFFEKKEKNNEKK